MIGGGRRNLSSGILSTVSGGYNNAVDGDYSTIAGGSDNTLTGGVSFVCGSHVSATADSAFVFGDGSETFSVGADNTASFLVNNGFRIWTANPVSSNIGTRLTAGGTSWVALSDSTTKENRRAANGKDILEKIQSMPIDRWNYKHQDESIEHVGPMAQDFWTAFGLGSDSLGIETIDADGVLFAAVQELAKQNAAQAQEIAELKNMVRQLVQLGNK